MKKYLHIQEEAYEANRQLPELGLVIFTFGNVSAADRALGVFAIKPSGVPYSELDPSKMVVVDFDGAVVEGRFVLLRIHPRMLHYTSNGRISAASPIRTPPMPRPGRSRCAIFPSTALRMPIILPATYRAQRR